MMTDASQAAARTKLPGIKAPGKAVLTPKARPAVVPIRAPRDILIPGGAVRLAHDLQMNVVFDPPNGAKVVGGSDWPAFNEVLLKSTMATIPNTDPDAALQRVAAVSAALAGFGQPTKSRG
jgi:hypothetical protein